MIGRLTIALAILRMVELEKTVVEGAAATPLAAMMAGKLPKLAGKRVALVVGGGNIDPAILSRVIEKGLVHDGRLLLIDLPQVVDVIGNPQHSRTQAFLSRFL